MPSNADRSVRYRHWAKQCPSLRTGCTHELSRPEYPSPYPERSTQRQSQTARTVDGTVSRQSTFEGLRRDGSIALIGSSLLLGMQARLVRSTPCVCVDPAKENGPIHPETRYNPGTRRPLMLASSLAFSCSSSTENLTTSPHQPSQSMWMWTSMVPQPMLK